MNEISFFAWGATRGLMFPYAHGRDAELKRQLVRAADSSDDTTDLWMAALNAVVEGNAFKRAS